MIYDKILDELLEWLTTIPTNPYESLILQRKQDTLHGTYKEYSKVIQASRLASMLQS